MILSFLGFLRNPLIAAAAALAVGFSAGFFKGHDSATDSFNAAQYEAQIAALKEERRKSDEIERQQATRISDLEQALRQINDEDPISGDGSECRLGAGLMRELARQYGQDWRGDPAISGSD